MYWQTAFGVTRTWDGGGADANWNTAANWSADTVPTSADIITAIDGQPITGMSGLVSYLASKTIPGQTVNLSVRRDGQEITIPVTLGERP